MTLLVSLPTHNPLPMHTPREALIFLYLLPKLGVALLVGTLIGLEREYRGKLAGIKTNALICSATAMFTAISILIGPISLGDPTLIAGNQADVSRIAAQIVSGISFLGAGAIFKSKDKVQGLTTAAVIWAVAALGILIGAGIFVSTIFIAIILIFFLTIVSQLEKKFFVRNDESKNTSLPHKN